LLRRGSRTLLRNMTARGALVRTDIQSKVSSEAAKASSNITRNDASVTGFNKKPVISVLPFD
jgi:hypothetical protein